MYTFTNDLRQSPRNGEWNMIDKKLYRPAAIQRWIVVIYERPQRFSDSAAQDMVTGLRNATAGMGTSLFYPLFLFLFSLSICAIGYRL